MSIRLMLIGGVPPSLSRRLIRVSHSQSRFNGSMIRVSHHRFNGLIDHQLSSPSPAMTVKSNVGKNDITPEENEGEECGGAQKPIFKYAVYSLALLLSATLMASGCYAGPFDGVRRMKSRVSKINEIADAGIDIYSRFGELVNINEVAASVTQIFSRCVEFVAKLGEYYNKYGKILAVVGLFVCAACVFALFYTPFAVHNLHGKVNILDILKGKGKKAEMGEEEKEEETEEL